MRARRAVPRPPAAIVRARRLRVVRWLVAVFLTAGSAPAAAQNLGKVAREVTNIEGDAQQLVSSPLRRSRLRGAHYVEERLTDGELFYRLQDYVRASIVFTDIVENHSGHRAHPDAMFLLGESLFHAGDYLGARTRFREVIRRSDESAFRPYAAKSLGRLIEIAIHTRDFEHVEDYFQRLRRLPPKEIEAATAYFRAKYLYNKAVPVRDVLREGAEGSPSIDVATLEEARRAFEAVADGSPYYAQARYFIGVIHTLRNEFPQAIEAFRRVLRSRATTPEQERVVDLTQLALGRLYYETDRIQQAVEAYQAVPRTSPHFTTALYEIAWAYIRVGDSTKADRALEVLSVVAPESPYIPDAKVLRGNLLLRNGRLEDASEVFGEVRQQFVPIRRQLEEMIAQRDDPQAYFRQLVRANMEAFDASAFLPEEAQRWARFEGDVDRALGVLSDLSQAKQLVSETNSLIQRLTAAIDAPNRGSVFADLRRHLESVTALRNRAARARRALLAIEEDELPSGNSELASARAERRRLERAMSGVPTEDEDFMDRDDELRVRYKALDRELSRLKVALMGMEAKATAAERFLSDTADERDPEGLDATLGELGQHREAVEQYQAEIDEIENLLEAGRLQVGVGDARYQRDDRLRSEYNAAVARERELMREAGVRLPPEIDRLFARIDKVESLLDRHHAKVDSIVDERVADIRKVLKEESQNLEGYREQVASLEGETETVVAGIAYENFNNVRERFYELVLEADVGRINVAWARREEHRSRVDLLSRERSREMRTLDDEFREIMDEDSAGGGE
ncbi:MAG: tetratricopeptide repeat protein [Myxococcota bacterium]